MANYEGGALTRMYTGCMCETPNPVKRSDAEGNVSRYCARCTQPIRVVVSGTGAPAMRTSVADVVRRYRGHIRN